MPVMRVAQIVRPAAGGIRRHVSALLSNLDRSLFAPTLFAPAEFRLDAPGIEVPQEPIAIAMKTSPLRDFRAIVALSRRLRGRFALVHAHGLRGALIGVPAARIARIPALFTAHNLAPPCGRLTASVLQFLGRTATVIAVSRAVATSLAAQGLDGSRIQVISNGVDVVAFDAQCRDELGRRQFLSTLLDVPGNRSVCVSPEWLRSARNLEQGLVVVVGIGRLSPEKGFDILISALSLADRLHQGAVGSQQPLLILAGSGPEDPRLRALASHVPNICLPGAVMDVVPLLTAADIVAVPSRKEGQGIVALEAMAARKPVVATRVGGLVETVEDGVTGLLVPPDDPETLADAIGLLLRSPELRLKMGGLGRERVEQKYTLDQMMERLTAVYLRSAVYPAC